MEAEQNVCEIMKDFVPHPSPDILIQDPMYIFPPMADLQGWDSLSSIGSGCEILHHDISQHGGAGDRMVQNLYILVLSAHGKLPIDPSIIAPKKHVTLTAELCESISKLNEYTSITRLLNFAMVSVAAPGQCNLVYPTDRYVHSLFIKNTLSVFVEEAKSKLLSALTPNITQNLETEDGDGSRGRGRSRSTGRSTGISTGRSRSRSTDRGRGMGRSTDRGTDRGTDRSRGMGRSRGTDRSMGRSTDRGRGLGGGVSRELIGGTFMQCCLRFESSIRPLVNEITGKVLDFFKICVVSKQHTLSLETETETEMLSTPSFSVSDDLYLLIINDIYNTLRLTDKRRIRETLAIFNRNYRDKGILDPTNRNYKIYHGITNTVGDRYGALSGGISIIHGFGGGKNQCEYLDKEISVNSNTDTDRNFGITLMKVREDGVVEEVFDIPICVVFNLMRELVKYEGVDSYTTMGLVLSFIIDKYNIENLFVLDLSCSVLNTLLPVTRTIIPCGYRVGGDGTNLYNKRDANRHKRKIRSVKSRNTRKSRNTKKSRKLRYKH